MRPRLLDLLFGLGMTLVAKAAMAFLLVHPLYRGALCLVAGVVDPQSGTCDVGRLGGSRHTMPIAAAAGGLAVLSMAGLPSLFGFISTKLLYEAKLQAPRAVPLLNDTDILARLVKPLTGNLLKSDACLCSLGADRTVRRLL